MLTGSFHGFTLRPATEADYVYCYRLTKRNMLALFTRHWGGWVPAAFRRGFVAANISVVIRDGRRWGYLSVKPDDEGPYVDNLQLSPSVRGQGLGTAILEELIRRNPKETLSLTTFADNPAVSLYRRLGFRVIRRLGPTWRMRRAPTG